MIYTGNNGRIYIARNASTGLKGTFAGTVVPSGIVAAANDKFEVRTITGGGSGAQVSIGSAISNSDTIRTRDFTVTNPGTNYNIGDTVRFYKLDSKNNTIDVSPTITIGETQTRGINTDAEILQEKYRVAKIRNWSINSNSEVIDTTALGDVAKTYLPSIVSGDGSATLLFYEDEGGAESIKLDAFDLMDILFPRTAAPRVTLSLAIDGSTLGATGTLFRTNFLFNAYITSASLGATYGEVVAIDTNFTIDGPLIEVPKK